MRAPGGELEGAFKHAGRMHHVGVHRCQLCWGSPRGRRLGGSPLPTVELHRGADLSPVKDRPTGKYEKYWLAPAWRGETFLAFEFSVTAG